MAKIYKVWACLEGEGEVEADDENEAFVLFSDDLMVCGGWQWTVEEIGTKDDNEEDEEDEED